MVGVDKEKIVKVANDLDPTNEQRYVLGSGDASDRITKIIDDFDP